MVAHFFAYRFTETKNLQKSTKRTFLWSFSTIVLNQFQSVLLWSDTKPQPILEVFSDVDQVLKRETATLPPQLFGQRLQVILELSSGTDSQNWPFALDDRF